ncbi:peptidylprolyl isomerase [candidate division KSB1 bacterium]|nr:peptidylprolyl isomerase [candidate division KSB1 bacterium]
MKHNYKPSVHFLISLSLAGVLFLSSCGKEGNKPVARVGGRTITVDEFKNAFSRGKSDEVLEKSTLQEKLDFLDNMIQKELEIVSAYQKGMQNDADVVDKVKIHEEKLIVQQLIEHEIIDKNISESELRNDYKNMGRHLQVMEIILEYPPNPKERENSIIPQKLKLLEQEIQKGVPFNKLAEKYSMETRADLKGVAKTYKWSVFNSQDSVYITAFSMKKGEISRPIKTAKGIKVIQLVDDKDVSQPAYEDEKDKIKRDIVQLRGRELEQKYYEWLDGLQKKYGTTEVEENIKTFINVVSDSSDVTKNAKEARDLENLFTKEQIGLELIRFNDGGSITVKQLFEEISRYPSRRRPLLGSEKELKNFLTTQIRKYVLIAEAKAQHMEKNKIVKEQLKTYTESVMQSKIVKMEVDDKIEVNEEKKKEYFEQHRDEFMLPEKREVQEILISDEKVAQDVVRRAKAGENFDKLAEKYNERNYTKKKMGNRGYIQRSMPNIGDPAFELKAKQVAGPIKNGKKWSVIKVLDIRPAVPRSYEEAEGFIDSKFRREVKDERTKEWMDELKKNIDVTIFQNRLDNTYAELREED